MQNLLFNSPSSHCEVRDGVEVGPEHLGVPKHFVPKSVETVQCDSDVRGCHPFLQQMVMLESCEQNIYIYIYLFIYLSVCVCVCV